MSEHPHVAGFGPVKFGPDGSVFAGRLTLTDVQWVRNPQETMLTCTLNAHQIASAAESLLLWTDQGRQRGIKPEAPPDTAVELALAAGYPDPGKYIFHREKADAMAEALLAGQRLFLSPLTWNLRPGAFVAAEDEDGRRVYLYSGKVYLPDSHHRHQAILKAQRLWEEAPGDYPKYEDERQFTVNVYFMSSDDEGEFFYEKNILGTPTAKSKAYDLTTQDLPSVLTKMFIDETPSLVGNVNRVTDRLTNQNRHIATLSTVRGFVDAAVHNAYDPEDLTSEAVLLSQFWELLVEVRPELGQLTLSDRVKCRQTLLTDQAVMLHGFAVLAKAFRAEALAGDLDAVVGQWRKRLERLQSSVDYEHAGFSGDVFDRSNPVWQELGVIQPTKGGGTAISNTRQTRAQCGQFLKEMLAVTGVGG